MGNAEYMGVKLQTAGSEDRPSTMQPGVLHWVITVAACVTGSVRAQDVCGRGEDCVSTRSCPAIVQQLTIARSTNDPVEKQEIINEVREKVCNKRERKVCCAQTDSPLDSNSVEKGEARIGDFNNIFHDIGGEAVALDSKTVLIKGFTYDGEGPDTFFLAGTSGRPSNRGDVVLPWPANGEKYTYADRDIPLIKRSFDGSEDILLTLPEGNTVDQLKWISVWCRDFDVDFGHVSFPQNFSLLS